MPPQTPSPFVGPASRRPRGRSAFGLLDRRDLHGAAAAEHAEAHRVLALALDDAGLPFDLGRHAPVELDLLAAAGLYDPHPRPDVHLREGARPLAHLRPSLSSFSVPARPSASSPQTPAF